MQSIRLTLGALALSAVVASLAACRDSPSAPSAPSDASIATQSPALATAAGASIRLRCERRATRSRVTAGGGTVTSASKRAVAGEAEFDFDSNRNDIVAGATPIPARFITARSGPDVVASILNASGQVVATQGAECSFP
jgi:hypothetical protein